MDYHKFQYKLFLERINSHFAWLIITCFGVGALSRCPGTLGSAVASVALYFLPLKQLTVLFSILFCLGCVFSYKHVVIDKHLSVTDPGYIVIDEVCGILFCGIFVYAYAHILSLWNIVANFVLFRIFDITKCFGIRYFEKSISKKHPATGIMLDDILAAIYAAFLQIIIIFLYKYLTK